MKRIFIYRHQYPSEMPKNNSFLNGQKNVSHQATFTFQLPRNIYKTFWKPNGS